MLISLLTTLFTLHAHAAAPCNGAQVGYWTNPDGSRGGSVASTAKVQAGATIASGAQVCEYAQVKKDASILENAYVGGRAVINAGAEISGRAKIMGDAHVGGTPATPTKIGGDVVIEGSPQITGASNIFARAKISGSSKVHNAVICQASQINGFDVVDSDYYCQTEDPEPKHPGELGKKTLLGVDSDRDGVRDDVEIWINDKYSNTPEKDNFNFRMAWKQKANLMNLRLKYKDSKEKVLQINKQIFDAAECIRTLWKNGSKSYDAYLKTDSKRLEENEELSEVLFNTPERVKEDIKTRRFSHGESLVRAGKSKDGCYFKKK